MAVRSEVGFWKSDRERYGPNAWLLQPSYWAVMIYRFGRWTMSAPRGIRPIVHGFYFAAYSFVRLATGIDLPRTAFFGPGLLIHHFGGIIINPQASVGANCVMRQGVTIGTKHDRGGAPRLGDGVTLGAYAQILGDITVGDGSTVGAMTVVLIDVPALSTIVGNPGRIIS